MGSLGAVREALAGVEREAARLPWAGERPWRARERATLTHGVLTLDLHDLSVRLALEAVERARVAGEDFGGMLMITGRGRHSGGASPLRQAVLEQLQARGEPYSQPNLGRVEVTWDSRKLSRARGGLGAIFWIVAALFATAALTTC